MDQRDSLLKFLHEEAIEFLEGPQSITHFDLSHHHVFLDQESGLWQVSGIIDWADAVLGPPEWDVVCLWHWTFDGVWQPGEKLPSENELARQFGVSRHTIREALRILELSGLLYIKSGVNGGPIVQGDITTTISNLYFDAFMMENVTVEEFTIARVAIEKAIVVEAIDKADEQDIKNLKACLEKAKESLAKKDLSEINHFEFHSLLARASKNTVFIILERGINAIHNEMRSRIVEGTPEDYRATKAAYREHEKILEALIKKDREKAMKLLEKHIVVVGKTFKPKK